MTDLFIVSIGVMAVAFVVTAFASTVQGTIGFGFAVLSVPVLSLLDPRLAPVPQLLLSLPISLWVVWRERHAVRLGEVVWILVGRLPGAVIGVVLIKLVNDTILDLLVASVVLVAVFVIATGYLIERTAVTKFSAGVVSGTFAMVASIGGPPLALLYRGAKGETLRANLAAIFCFGLVLTIGTRVATGEMLVDDVILAAWLLPGTILGLLVSGKLGLIAEGRPLRIGVLLIASLAALGLFARALL